MSYIISIKPVSDLDLEKLTQSDGNITLEKQENFTSITVTKDEEKFIFSYSCGEIISLSSPSDKELQLMQDIAFRLKARVVGEEGEDITISFKQNADIKGCAPAAKLVLTILWLFIMYYWMYF
jgi:hypothetical protein